jgi:hypothetical protein
MLRRSMSGTTILMETHETEPVDDPGPGPCIRRLAAAPARWTRPNASRPAKPGGGFDLTCKLAQSALMDGKYIADPMRVTYMPGGIGAVAYNAVVAQRPADRPTPSWPSPAARC